LQYLTEPFNGMVSVAEERRELAADGISAWWQRHGLDGGLLGSLGTRGCMASERLLP
jgi:hypothetical protein